MALVSLEQWKRYYQGYTEPHFLQSPSWGVVKADFGWEAVWVEHNEAGAQILFKKLPGGMSIAYIPKGPLGEEWAGLWPVVDPVCRQRKAIFLKVEPDRWEESGVNTQLLFPGFRKSDFTIQPRRTIVVDLEGGEEAWLNRMRQKTRYNIKLAERKGIQVALSSDVETFFQLALVTGKRDGFGVHSLDYYQKVFDIFTQQNQCALFIATYENRPLAGLMVLRSGKRTWYLYGASNDEERNRMPTYLIQHAAMKWAFEAGCSTYDLWGIPDYDDDYLEANFPRKADGLWGVYRFKRGFGGKSWRSDGAWDRVYSPALYKLYTYWMRRRASGGIG
ncbi:MAG: peptidoglycan bridge formation glycyltransferase FemA/FemB family protein [Anaerolineaceae bacterium]|nr:peptidoglycan bridge formation glycyltransferase FemA/FemB family protein [Anaerolineaceae bacterium]